MSLSVAEARKIALSFPGAEERLSYGTPAIFVGKKTLVRIGTREPDTIQLNFETFEERDHLIAADPETFYITEHFRSFKGLLARRAKLDAKTFRALVDRRWRQIAPKALVRTAASKS
jgi:hypothetical protein